MSEKEQKAIFEELKDCVGIVLAAARVNALLWPKELAQKLGVSKEFIDDIENKRIFINFRQLQLFCKILNQEVILILKLAKEIQTQDGKPEKEILKNLMDELKYQIWKLEQENQ